MYRERFTVRELPRFKISSLGKGLSMEDTTPWCTCRVLCQ